LRKKKSYLELLLKDEIVEGQPDYSVFARKTKTALQDILEVLKRAARDSRIAAISLTLQDLVIGWARLSDLRRALVSFRQSGKPVYCFMKEGGNAEYYLASACDQIFMPPSAHLNLIGLSAEIFFFRDLLDRFGIKPQIQAVGEYKSAGEMFTRTSMSQPAREQMEALLDDSYDELCRAVQGRGFSTDESAGKINSGPYTAREALEQKLLDGICYPDEVPEKIKEKLGKKVHPAEAHKYYTGEGFLKRLFTFRRPRIAIINVQGLIDSGESRRNQAGRNVAGAETIIQFLDHANKSGRVQAIVLRIDSPGGSGLASDLIWRKISLVGKSKPIVVSFGDVAASGGYYIAVPAARILSEPTSITGSIGVLAGKVVARELMSRLSVNRDSIQRGDHAAYESLFSEFSQDEFDKLGRRIEEFYREDFLRKVADGRKMNEESVDQVGRGRVWSGKRAKEHQLVDQIGGLLEAIQEAKKLARIPERKKVRVIHYHRRRRLWERLMPDFRAPISAVLPDPAVVAIETLEMISSQPILLLMPYQIRIR
jgi:protease-4